MRKKDQESFLKKMSILLSTSVPLKEAIQLSSSYSKNKEVLREASLMHKGVLEGASFSSMLGKSGSWSETTIALARVGELSGSLGTYLKEAANVLREEREEKSKMISALIYPALVGILSFSMVIFLISFIFPKIMPLFEGLKAGLPWSTRAVIFLNKMILSFGLITLGVLALLSSACFYLIRSFDRARTGYENILLSFPLIGNIFRQSILRQAAFLIGSLLSSGIPFDEALLLIERSQSLSVVKAKFSDLLIGIRSGTAISECLSRENLFMPWTDLVLIGEKSGSLPEMFIQLSLMHKENIEEVISSSTKLIEPVLMIVVGAIVGIIALSIITPMYSLTQYVH